MSLSPKPGRLNWTTELALAALVFAFTAGIYWLTYSGSFHSGDERVTFASIENLVKHGTLTTEQLTYLRTGKPYSLEWNMYSKYGPAQAVLNAPLYWLALQLDRVSNVQLVLTSNLWGSALTLSLVFLLLTRLGYSVSVSLGSTLLLGFGTAMWPYAKYFFSEPQSAFLLVLAAYWLYSFGQGGRVRHVALASVCLALALATRTNNIVAVPAFGLYGLALLIRRHSEQRLRVSNLVAVALAALVPLAAWAAEMLFYNQVRFGHPLSTGYGVVLNRATRILGYPILQGLFAQLLSPAHSLFLYSPVVILGLAGFPLFWRRHRLEGSFIGLLAVSAVLFYARLVRYGGTGGLQWGQRYLVVILPFLGLAVAPLLAWLVRKRSWLAWGLFAAVVAISVAVQALGVSLRFDWYGVKELLWGMPKLTLGAYFDPRFSWLAAAVAHLDAASADFAWLRVLPSGILKIDWLALCVTLLWILSTGTALLICTRRLRKGERIGRRSALGILAALALIVAGGSGLLLRRYYTSESPYREPTEAMIAHIDGEAQPGDVILAVYTYNIDDLFRYYKGSLYCHGLPLSATLDPKVQELLQTVYRTNSRFWFVVESQPVASPENGVERWLSEHAYRADFRWVPGFGYLALYSRPEQESLSQAMRVDARFDNGIVLTTIGRDSWQVHPGQALHIQSHWQTSESQIKRYKAFAQLIDVGGKVISQNDSEPAADQRPTTSWHPGEVIEDRRAILVPEAAAPGTYALVLGLYDVETQMRVLVAGSDRVLVGEVQVQANLEADQ